jgi:four helix bundle protein
LYSQPSRRGRLRTTPPSRRLQVGSLRGINIFHRVLAAFCREGREDAAKEDSMISNAIQPAAGDRPGEFDFHRFDVYRVALEFQALVPSLLPRRGVAGLRDQLDRASTSIVLNIAEGAGRFARAEKASFYLIARGSATECAAVVDVLLTRRLITAGVHRHAHGLLIRVAQMLTKPALRMQE